MFLRHQKEFARGFTLIELMVTVMVLGIITAIAVPSFAALLQSQRVSSAATQVYSLFALARSEAVARHKLVVICTTHDGANCVAQAQGNVEFSQGMMAFVRERDSDAALWPDIANGDELIAVQSAFNGVEVIFSRGSQLLVTPQGGTDAAQFLICQTEPSDSSARRLSITGAGQMTQTDAVGANPC